MAKARTWWFRVYNLFTKNIDRQLRIKTADPRKKAIEIGKGVAKAFGLPAKCYDITTHAVVCAEIIMVEWDTKPFRPEETEGV